jgi:hypothetical protein
MFCFRNKKKTTIKPEYVSKTKNENTIQVWENKKIIKKVVVGNPLNIKIVN